MTEGQLLALQLDKARELSRWYLSFLKNVDVLKTFEVEGKYFNSVMWEVGHLTVSENSLVLFFGNGEPEKIAWGKHFSIGSNNQLKEPYPAYSEVWSTYRSVHEKVIAYITSLTPEQLDQPLRKPFGITNAKTVRDIIIHACRHESTHTGHLSWLCKMHGVKTI